MEQKKKLIAVLKREKQRLDNGGADTHDHYLTIDFLETNSYGCDPLEVSNYPILEAAINDYENLLLYYGIV